MKPLCKCDFHEYRWIRYRRLPWLKRLLTGYDCECELAVDNGNGTLTIYMGYGKNPNAPYDVCLDMEGNEFKK